MAAIRGLTFQQPAKFHGRVKPIDLTTMNKYYYVIGEASDLNQLGDSHVGLASGHYGCFAINGMCGQCL